MAAAITHSPTTTLESPVVAHPAAATASSKTPADSEASAAISANDFLTLLVTEMKNQDPTATTDPNEYINQLVNVNSLEQLIDINQTLTSAYGSSSAYTASNAAAQGAGGFQSAAPQNQPATHFETAHSVSPIGASAASTPAQTAVTVPGNLGLPANNPAAERLAEALGGSSRLLSGPGISAVR